MRDFLNRSFRTKLLVSFLLIGMVPLLLCTVLMLGIFQSSLHRSVADTAQTQLDALCGDLDGLLDVLVPKLMLQPLVENAIIHGFEDSDGGEIVVSAREELGRLLITVSDDGRGMSEESLRNFQAQILPGPGRHLGLHNVDAILRLHYGPDNGLRFVPTGGRGTCVRITLPITRREVPSC